MCEYLMFKSYHSCKLDIVFISDYLYKDRQTPEIMFTKMLEKRENLFTFI